MDPTVIATVGSLVGITGDVIAALKELRSLFDTRDSKRIANEAQTTLDQMKDSFAVFSGRLEILSIQLEQSESLTRMVPAWLEVANRMPVWRSAGDLTPDDVQRLDGDLRSFINDSVRDHFSTTFFRSNFNQLPEVEKKLDIFRAKLKDLDRTVSAIPPGNVEVFKGLWAAMTTQFNDLRNAAWEISQLADDVQGNLIRELREAAVEAKRFAG